MLYNLVTPNVVCIDFFGIVNLAGDEQQSQNTTFMEEFETVHNRGTCEVIVTFVIFCQRECHS